MICRFLLFVCLLTLLKIGLEFIFLGYNKSFMNLSSNYLNYQYIHISVIIKKKIIINRL